jgi:hypothetical protein
MAKYSIAVNGKSNENLSAEDVKKIASKNRNIEFSVQVWQTTGINAPFWKNIGHTTGAIIEIEAGGHFGGAAAPGDIYNFVEIGYKERYD